MKSIPAYTIAGITRPELFLDFDGNIILTPAALAFADQYGLKALYLGCPPGTPFPPVPGFIMTTPVDTNTADNIVAENAAANTTVGITAEAHDIVHFPITYSLTADSSGGGFKINATTGVVTVDNPDQINFEASASHSYNITVRATDGIFATTQTFTINVSDVAPTTPTDTNGAANTVVEGAANGTAVGVTANSTDIHGGTVTYSIAPGGDTSGGGFTVNSTTGVVTVADATKIDYESAPGHAYTVTVVASDGTLTSSQTFTIAVTDAPVSTPVDANNAANNVIEGAAIGSTVGYALTADTSLGGFTINAATGVVTVADSTKINFESAPGHAYSITVQATAGLTTSSQTFTIGVADVAPTTPVDSDGAANTVAEGAANGSTVGVTAFSTDINGPAGDLQPDRR